VGRISGRTGRARVGCVRGRGSGTHLPIVLGKSSGKCEIQELQMSCARAAGGARQQRRDQAGRGESGWAQTRMSEPGAICWA